MGVEKGSERKIYMYVLMLIFFSLWTSSFKLLQSIFEFNKCFFVSELSGKSLTLLFAKILYIRISGKYSLTVMLLTSLVSTCTSGAGAGAGAGTGDCARTGSTSKTGFSSASQCAQKRHGLNLPCVLSEGLEGVCSTAVLKFVQWAD